MMEEHPEILNPVESMKKTDAWTAFVFLAPVSLFYAILVISSWSLAYIDFGDGNYLYISSRIADGLVLYRDIMAPQPPMHLLIGSVLIRIGRAIGNPLFTVRAFSLLVHLATMFMIFLTARKLFNGIFEGILAGILYLMIPIGFWWSLGYQSEGLLILFLTASFYFFIDLKPRSMIFAALFGTLAAFTNMTAVPYLFLANLFLLVRKRRLMLSYTLPMFILGILGIIVMEIYSGGHYLENVFLNQVGTFPKREISGQSVFSYAIGKIINEGKDVMTWEGGYVLFGLAGLLVYTLKGETINHRREYIAWHSFFSFFSIGFVSKGGTMEYIFTIGEPYVVLFFAYLAGFLWRGPMDTGKKFRKFYFTETSRFAALATLILLLAANFYIGFFFIKRTLGESQYELSEDQVKIVREIIREETEPGDPILAPPYYAFISETRVVEEYSENYIWTIKYANETVVEKEPGEGVAKALAIAQKLKNKEIPLVLLDMGQTGKLPPIKSAINQYYQPLNVWNGSHILQTLNTRIGFFVPKE